MKRSTWLVAIVTAFIVGIGITEAGWPPKAEAVYVPQTTAFEVTCGSTATHIDPATWSRSPHAITCGLSKETPDDSAECVCLGDANIDNDDLCFPVGGCARAIVSTIAINGSTHCLREDASDVVLVCLAGRGQP